MNTERTAAVVNEADPVIAVDELSYSYRSGGRSTPTLRGVSFRVEKGEFVGVLGRSGAGKSTLFYLLGGLLKPDGGRVTLDGIDLTRLSADESAAMRNRRIGFVFQQFHLLARASVLDNILLPTRYPCETARPTEALRERAALLATKLGLGERLHHMPNQLSGGEQQRVAIARALMTEPDILLADEPTGNLDSRNALQILDLLKQIRAEGKTILLITHDAEVAKHCSRLLYLTDGKVSEADGGLPQKPGPARLVKKPERLIPLVPNYLRLVGTVLPLALQNLKRSKTRAFLTMIGVTIGIAALFSMITFGQFARDQILAGFEELGSDAIMIRGWPSDRRSAKAKVDVVFDAFDWDKDLKALPRVFPQVKLMSPFMAGWGNSANFGGRSASDDVMTWGIGAEFHRISRRQILSGGPITALHVERRSPVCLVGTEIVDRLFRDVKPVGQILFLSKQDGSAFPCRILGVLAPQSSNMDWRKPNLDIVLPWTYFASVTSSWESRIHSFVAQVDRGHDVERVGAGLRNYFQQKYGSSGTFVIDANSLLVAQIKKSVVLFTLLLSTISLVTLMVGGMGINNMMLVSLAERFKEIGLCKAVGATDRSVRIQFLLESTFLSALAGVVGILVGFSAYEGIIFVASKVASKLKFAWIVDPTALVVSLVSVVGVGIASGMVPALKAERLTVIEALRSE